VEPKTNYKYYHGPGGLISVGPKGPTPEQRAYLETGEYKQVRMEGMRILREGQRPYKKD